jgi:putative ABC transport system ATP-binding protein
LTANAVTPGPLVHLDGVSKAFGERRILRDVDLELRPGEVTSLVGASGSGKSTLVSLLAGLSAPDEGHVVFDGARIDELNDAARAHLRAERIGVVLQSGNLIPFLTAAENVELATRFGQGDGARARDALSDLGVGDRADHLPRRMSGGQAQRVTIAVALANDPDLLLADEITGQLDTQTAGQVMAAIADAGARRERTVLFVTHDHDIAGRADRRLVLENGRVRQR